MNSDSNAKRLRSRIIPLKTEEMSLHEDTHPPETDTNLDLPTPLTTRENTRESKTDSKIDELCKALNTLIDNHEKTHHTLMAHVMQPNQSRQSTGDNSQDDTRRDRRSTNSGTHSGHRLIPKDIKFGGTSDEDVTAFINSLIRYATYVHLSDDDLCDLFPLTLSNRAEFWFQSLPSSITKNWTCLSNTYLEKYGPSSRGFVHEVALLERVQNPNESIDAYASDLINRFQMTGTREPERWKTFVRGLQPELKAFVLDKGCSTFDEAETLAKKAEQLKFITSPVG